VTTVKSYYPFRNLTHLLQWKVWCKDRFLEEDLAEKSAEYTI